jgi:hypothetical protein
MLTPTTELNAVNTILATIGEAAVNSLDDAKPVDAANALNTLREVSRDVQSRGWSWNTDYKYPVARDGDNKLPVPSNSVRVSVPSGRYTDIDPIPRGAFFYDRKNHTYTFTKSIELQSVVWALDFTDLPEIARRHVTIKAARTFVDRYFPAQELHVYSKQDELLAWAELLREECKAENISPTNTLEYQKYNLHRRLWA